MVCLCERRMVCPLPLCRSTHPALSIPSALTLYHISSQKLSPICFSSLIPEQVYHALLLPYRPCFYITICMRAYCAKQSMEKVVVFLTHYHIIGSIFTVTGVVLLVCVCSGGGGKGVQEQLPIDLLCTWLDTYTWTCHLIVHNNNILSSQSTNMIVTADTLRVQR